MRQRTLRFYKYHALGNDYLVLDPKDWNNPEPPRPKQIRKICHRHYGLGSDGILWGPFYEDRPAARDPYDVSALPDRKDDAFGLRIFNPDGTEAEKSGNGLRIFSRYLYDQKLVSPMRPFRIATAGGIVESTVFDEGNRVRVEMGRVSFASDKIPVALDPASGPLPREVINEHLTAGDREFTFCAATIGNPHCVIPVDKATYELARNYGPLIERHPLFPNRTNVQFLEVINNEEIRIEIWERGAGYTYASGSSSSAAAAVAYKLRLVDDKVTVHMVGGDIEINIKPDFSITMTGPVTVVGEYRMSTDVLSQWIASRKRPTPPNSKKEDGSDSEKSGDADAAGTDAADADDSDDAGA